MVLEHQADVAAQIGHCTARQAADILAANRHYPAGRALDRGDEFQQRALAGAGVSGEEDQFALLDGEADAGESFVPAGIALGDLAEADHAVNTASTNSRASKGRRSSTVSPTPM